jgi:outer membrane murein-binding lipoprotein Lpp
MSSSILLSLVAAAVAIHHVHAAELHEEARLAANPIRKVVSMLQRIEKKVQAEGERETAMYEKYQCTCKTGGAGLEKSIVGAEAKISELRSAIEETEAQNVQLGQDLAQHRSDREAATRNLAEAKSIRSKDASVFATYKATADSNIAALGNAVAALEKGMAGSFLQSSAAGIVQKLVRSTSTMVEFDRSEVEEFLQSSHASDYSPQSSSITGILKQLKDTMTNNLAEAASAELAAIKDYDGLVAAKSKEIQACTHGIEVKTVRGGEVAVLLVTQKQDLSDTGAALAADQHFSADLAKNCAAKALEWDVVVKARNEELAALADTIVLLSSDGALELFKKALPGSSASLIQIKTNLAATRAHALTLIHAAQADSRDAHPQLNFIALALRGKKLGFAKIVAMVDDLTDALKKEQVDDNGKQEYCQKELDSLDDKQKALERSLSDAEAAISDAQEVISSLVVDIETLESQIKALDKMVAEATEQRKGENEDFAELMAQETAAQELIRLARNRLYKFYEPKLYLPPPDRQLSADDQIVVNMGGTIAPTPAPGGISGTGISALLQVSEHVQAADNKNVIAMLDLLIKDLDKSMTVAQQEEHDSQSEYEEMLKDSKAKGLADAASLTQKSSAKVDMEAALQAHLDDKAGSVEQLAATLKAIQATHSSCDWLLKYWDVRKEARDDEIDSLAKAKAVLSGADYALLLQTTKRTATVAQRGLRGRAD